MSCRACARGSCATSFLALVLACDVRQDLGRLDAPPGDAADAGAPAPSFPSTTPRAGWRWVTPFPTGDDLRGAFAAPSRAVWLLGANGTVLRRDVSGSIVEMLEPDAETRWYTGWATAEDDVWIVGERRGATDVRRWDGRRWTDAYSLRNYPVHAITGASRDVAWAAASVFGATWNGAVWLEVPADTTAPLRALWASRSGDAWGVGDRGALLRWEGGAFRDTRPVAASPAYLPDRSYVAVWGASPADVWAAYEAPLRGEVGFVHFDGAAWSDTPAIAAACTTRPDTTQTWARGARMAGTSTRILAAVGQGCTFTYDGERWSARTRTDPLALEVAVTSVVASGSELFAVGDRGALLRFDDAASPAPFSPVFPALREDLGQVLLAGDEPWALAPARIVRLVDGQWQTVAGSERATAFTFDARMDLWFARDAGDGTSELVHRHRGADDVTAKGLGAHVTAMTEREGVLWLAGARGFVARGDGRAFTTLAPPGEETFTSIALVDRDTAVVGAATPISQDRFSRKVLRVTGSGSEVLVADESGSKRAAVHVAAGGEIWVGGLPLLRLAGTRAERVSVGDDSPVDSIAPAGGAALWLAGGGLIRRWDGAMATRVFGTGRKIFSLASGPSVAWAVGEQGATLAFLPQGPPPR